jgi:hypothetical protein
MTWKEKEVEEEEKDEYNTSRVHPAQVGDMIRIEEEVDPFFLLDEKNKIKRKNAWNANGTGQ